MINLQASEIGVSPVMLQVVEKAARAALRASKGAEEAELTIVLTDDDQLRLLNRQYLGIDAPTDVLSFPSGIIDPDTHRSYLGDVLISIPRASLQAAEAGHSLEEEVRLLTVHGVLHLLGFDHADESEKARMWALQDEILSNIPS